MASSLLPVAAASGFCLAPSTPQRKNRRLPPLTISTSSSHLDPTRIRELLHAAGHSCHRFPNLGPDGRPEPVELDKLRIALTHSAVVVSVFCRSRNLQEDRLQNRNPAFIGLEELFQRAAPIPGDDLQLVGFGRAVTDGGMTASIYDVVVIPSLQRLGIGQKIVHKIVRFLTNRGVYDISALCTEEERLLITCPFILSLFHPCAPDHFTIQLTFDKACQPVLQSMWLWRGLPRFSHNDVSTCQSKL